jgi:hypothetical protein
VSKKQIEVELSMARSSNGLYYVRVMDETSRTLIVEVEMTGEQYAQALTGLYAGGYKATVGKDLSVVGKRRVSENRTIYAPIKTYDKDKLQAWMKENCQEEGWEIDYYIGSQSSLRSVDDLTQINYRVYKYVGDNE